MAVPDPIPTLTVDSVTYDFARVGADLNKSVYSTADGNNVLEFSHRYGGNRNAYRINLQRKALVADVYVPDTYKQASWSASLLFNVPTVGVTAAQADKLGQLLTAVAVSGTPDYVLRLLQGEV